MKQFEVLSRDPLKIRAIGSTRAGLIVAAVKGMFAGVFAEADEEADDMERPFNITANDSAELLVKLLNEAKAFSVQHQERYEDIHFALITDKKAEGSFVGRRAKFVKPLTSATEQGVRVEKNADGNWEATVGFES